MEMVKEMDAGDMVSQKALPILDQDNVGTMFEKLAVLGRDLLLETLPAYIAGEIKPVPQDASQVTFSPNISPEEERLDWNKSGRDIFNQIRGMYPWPVAHTLLNGKRFKIYEGDLVEGQGQAGHIIEKLRRVWSLRLVRGLFRLRVFSLKVNLVWLLLISLMESVAILK